MPEHRWELEDAKQLDEFGDTLDLTWICDNCGKRWQTVCSANMPETVGECEPDSR